jgi:tellurite resistance protein TerC
LRAFYFLLAGVLPYFRYLDEGLAVVLMFIGGKMLAEPWFHLSTGISLATVGVVIAASIAISILAARAEAQRKTKLGPGHP